MTFLIIQIDENMEILTSKYIIVCEQEVNYRKSSTLTIHKCCNYLYIQ